MLPMARGKPEMGGVSISGVIWFLNTGHEFCPFFFSFKNKWTFGFWLDM